ncbi:putative pyruvate, phosphate dikinase regulatory protein [Tistrella bauzanensis]|uniref:Putative pyruvate, phosphate dikinase regulatory protein n=2 Tax=Tistrella bauzanensis TaxID=657419 RepID=A0ABQ1IPJ2_9PROT|nr:putative pyruvate, phosphate dikinase regulatory protein [Tistrella bauzanensis]
MMPLRGGAHGVDAARQQVLFDLHLVSDSSGETVNTVARAVLAQFDGVDAREHVWSLVRSPAQLEKVINSIEAHPGLVMYTLALSELRERLEEACRRLKVPCVPVLDPITDIVSGYLGVAVSRRPGRRHMLDQEYFARIDAMHFALIHDDGQSLWDIDDADVILVGVSRSSKTPTAIYLANRGVKAANVPLVPGHPLPDEVEAATRPFIVGLTTSPERLVQIRRNRLLSLNQPDDSEYIDLEAVRTEVIAARRLFERKGWPSIDVTRRSIEETAAAIYQMYLRHIGDN